MAAGTSLQTKIAAVLKKLNPKVRPVALRRRTLTGGDGLLGVGQVEAVTDTIVDGASVDLLEGDTIATSGGKFLAGDYRFILPGSIAESALRNCQLLYGSDVFNVVTYDPVSLYGTVIIWQIVARTAKPGD